MGILQGQKFRGVESMNKMILFYGKEKLAKHLLLETAS